MIHVGKTRLKQLAYVLLSALIIGGAFSTLASLSKQSYVVRTVHVFPSELDAVGWNNVETLTFQNLDEYALLQDFNDINSASFALDRQVNLSADEDEEPASSNTGSSGSTVPDTVPAVPPLPPTSTVTSTPPVPDNIAPAPTSSAATDPLSDSDDGEATASETEQTEEVDIESPETPEETPVPESLQSETAATTTVMKTVDRLFALAIDSLTVSFSSTSATSAASTPPAIDDSAQSAASASGTSDQSAETESEQVIPATTEQPAVVFGFTTSSEEVLVAEDEVLLEATTSTVTDTQPVAPSATSTATSGVSVITIGSTTAERTDASEVSCGEECLGYTIRMGNFGYPLEERVELSGAQLRMSFAAKHKPTREDIPFFTINYSLDGGESWSTGGSIMIDDEVSNSLNGGYFLFALPAITDQATLQNLQVELRYDDDPALITDLFVESVWLELFTLEPPEEEVAPDFAELLADDGYQDTVLSGDTLAVSGGETIDFTFTDSTAGETLIVKSDQKTYEGLSEATTYFSVTNTGTQADEFSVQTYFPNDLGEVTDLQVYNVNKPRDAVIPEYRPYVYHCEAGWELGGGTTLPQSLTELSVDTAATSSDVAIASSTDVSLVASTTATSSVLAVSENASTSQSIAEQYSCRDTSVVRTCDELDGEATACVVRKKVADHAVTKYAPGWDPVTIAAGAKGSGGVGRRIGSFLGFGPKKKDIPAKFEARAFSDGTFEIAPGETRYFKLDISFPPFSTGEYWIEVVGDREYGLLDPFWSSEWRYRMPLLVENPTGSAQTDFQVRLEFDSSLTDFWSNVESDGSDLRFVQEVATGNFSNEATAVNNWIDLDFSHRVPIEIPANLADADLTDFPVSLDLSTLDGDFWTNVKADGGDIRVYYSDGTEVPIDLAYFDATGQIGELHFLAASVPSQAATTYYLYYGDSTLSGYAATDPLGAQAVWVNYKAVYHFTEDPTTIGNEIIDVTGNGYNVAVQNAAMATSAGQYGLALDMSAGAGYLATTTWTFPGGDPLIVTGSFNMPVVSNEGLFQWGTGNQPNSIVYYPWYGGDNGRWTFGNTSGDEYESLAADFPGEWHGFGVIGTTSTSDNNYVYEDGVLVETLLQSVANPSNTNANGFQIGRAGGGSWSGHVDELRIATSTRSQARVKAESLALETPGQFYNYQPIQVPGNAANRSWYSTSWEGRQRVTIPSSRVAGDVTDFPVYVDLSILGASFFSRVASDGSDIRITLGDGVTEVPHELVDIDTGGQTGELYFKADLNDGQANEFYIYFDNEDAIGYANTDTYGAQNVWTNDFQAVYHFEESAAGIGNPDVYLDSTANEYHGDDETTSNDTTGRLGNGLELGDTFTDHVSLPRDVLNGLTDNTVSWWHQTSELTDQAILSGANSGQANEFWLRLDNSTVLRYYDSGAQDAFTLAETVGSYNDGTWQYHTVVADAGSQELYHYVNGLFDTQNPNTGLTIDAISVDNGGVIVGQDQDSVGGGFNDGENFTGLLDELRVSSAVRSYDWARTEYENMNNPGRFFSTSSAETLAVTTFTELDFWVQRFDYANQIAEVWVQVPELTVADTLIYTYYGNSGAVSASDEMETFSYDSLTELYYVVDGSSADDISVVSLIDNNQVQLDGGTIIDLNRGEQTTFSTFGQTSALSVLGPVSATIIHNTGDSTDIMVPIAFATSTFAIPINRNNNQTYLYSPFASTTIETFIGSSATPDATFNLATGTGATASTNPGGSSGSIVDGDGIVVESTGPILATHRSTNPGDGLVAYPPTTEDLYGVYSGNIIGGGLFSNPDPTYYCSGGNTGTYGGLTRGDHDVNNTSCSGGNEGTGEAVRLTGAATPVSFIQQADSDGNESTVFWPAKEFGATYAVTSDTAYVAIVCAPGYGTANIEVQDAAGTVLDSGTCTPGTTDPGKLYFGTDGDTLEYTTGTLVLSTNGVPFYAIMEDVSIDDDEKNMLGAVQARQFGGDAALFEAAPQEEANGPQYEQLSFAWYENDDVLTPTDRWSLGVSETVAEAEAISGTGAVEEDDVLRLRMNAVGQNATGTAGTEAFILQYAPGTSGQCSAVTSWYPLGEVGSTTAAFAGYNNSSVGDGTTLSSTTLAASTIFGTYEERNFSDFNPVDIGPGDVVEWDWAITAANVLVNQTYCFRMIRAIGEEFSTYTTYPELETVGPPDTPVPLVYFDNENTADVYPSLEFVASDIAGDEIHYRVQIDDDYDFSSVALDQNSQAQFLRFTNISNPADKAPFASAAQVRYTPTTPLSATTTYWWRVRASDPDGSATSSDWSTPVSFTIDTLVTVTEWVQTTAEQFATNELSNLSTSTGQVSLTADPGVMTSTGIDFDDATVGNAWGSVEWNATETSGDIAIQVQYNDNGTWTNIPASVLPNNDVGATTSPISILELDTSIYNELRLVANLTGTTVSLQDWTVKWGQRVETPEQGDPFDNQKTAETLPVFDMVSSDPQDDDLEYEISFSTSVAFDVSSTTYNSSTSAQFANTSNGADTSPFSSGDTVTFTTPGGTPFTDGVTYWWRSRARDPEGGNAWSPWSTPDSFTVDTAVTLSTWFQTTEDQFEQGVFDGTTASGTGAVVITDEIGEYGTATLVNNNWLTVNTTREYDNMVVVVSPEYNVTALTDGRTPRVRNKTSNSFDVKVDDHDGFTGSTIVDYIVMEAGEWELADGSGGLTVLAGTESEVTETISQPYGTTNNGRTVTVGASFGVNPIALATVVTDNDSTWVTSHLDGGSSNTEWSGGNIRVALGKSTSGLTHSSGEDIDYILFDAGTGSNNGTVFQSLQVRNDVQDSVDNAGHNFTLTGFTSTPAVTVLHQNSEGGGDGSMALKDLSGTNSNTNLFASVIEVGVSANGHAGDESVSVVAFENSSGILTRRNGGNLTGTFTGEDIIFSDGNGPKFDNFSWVETTLGGSEISIQLEYQVSSGVYALLPDEQVPGNSAGFTSSPINLTGIDIDIYPQIRAVATLTCNGGVCPTLDEWQLEWSEGVEMSGSLYEYDRTTPVSGNWYDSSWSDRTAITIQSSAVDDPLTDFPVYLDLADLGPDFFSTVESDGADIRITTSDGQTEVPYDLVDIDTGGETGELHFLADAIASSTDTTFYLYYGNALATGYAATSTYGSENVWTNNYGLVYHMDAAGTDSTSNGRDRVADVGDPSVVQTYLGDGIDFDGDDAWDQANLPYWEDAFTTQAQRVVFTTGANVTTRQALFAQGGGTNGIMMYIVSNNLYARWWSETDGWAGDHISTSVDANTTYDATMVFDAGSYEFFVNGSSVGSNFTVATTGINAHTGDGGIAYTNANKDFHDTSTGPAYFTGQIHEFRTYDAARPDGWYRASAVNISTTTDFYATSSSPASSGAVRAAVNGTPVAGSAAIAGDGTWTLSNVTAFAGDVVTVWMDGAADADEAVTAFIYDGLGDISGLMYIASILPLTQTRKARSQTYSLVPMTTACQAMKISSLMWMDYRISRSVQWECVQMPISTSV